MANKSGGRSLSQSGVVFYLLLNAFISGCQLAPGGLSSAELATDIAVTIKTPSPIYTEGTNFVRIVGVDGSAPYPYDYEIVTRPGPHQLQLDIDYTVPTSTVPGLPTEKSLTTRALETIEVVTAPGGQYRILVHQIRGGELHVWIVDEISKQVVAGAPPS